MNENVTTDEGTRQVPMDKVLSYYVSKFHKADHAHTLSLVRIDDLERENASLIEQVKELKGSAQ